METTLNLDATLEAVADDSGFVTFHETVESALNRVAKTFGFDYKKMVPVKDLTIEGEGNYEWQVYNVIWYEGYFKVNGIIYHFRYDIWNGFKPSLWTE